MSFLAQYVPPGPGLLPKWLLFIAVVSLGNSIQTYKTLYFNKRIYSAQPNEVTGLSSRTFGTWTIITAIVRMYGAYNLSSQPIFDLCWWTYAVALWHFSSELLIFKTASFKGQGLFFPLIVAVSSLTWFWMQRDFYLGNA